MGAELICREFMNGLVAIEQADFVYSHEYLPLGNMQSHLLAQHPIIKDFVAPNFTRYVLMRSKHNLSRS